MQGNDFQVFGTPTFGRLYNTSRDMCLGRTEEEKAANISDITHIKHLSMGVKSKANKARLRNIQSALSKSPHMWYGCDGEKCPFVPWWCAFTSNSKVFIFIGCSCMYTINNGTQRRYANRSVCFISTYVQGLTGGEAAWANRQYHGHRTLPPSMILEVKESLRKA